MRLRLVAAAVAVASLAGVGVPAAFGHAHAATQSARDAWLCVGYENVRGYCVYDPGPVPVPQPPPVGNVAVQGTSVPAPLGL